MADQPRTGKFLRMPYDWRRPTVSRAKIRWWNPGEPRFIVPKSFGWGWTFNFARLFGRRPAR